VSNVLPPSPHFPADNPAVIAHINLLQGIITRLANNSASCKTWCVTLVGALVSLAGAVHAPGVITFALVPVVMFGYLDTMYLAQEKAYRDLYKTIREAICGAAYELKDAYIAVAVIAPGSVWDSLTSWSIWPVYGGLIAAYLAAYYSGWLNVLTTNAK
jgi:hypothetical protein